MAAVTVAGAKPIETAQIDTGDSAIASWTLTTADPTGDPLVGYEDYADRTVQLFGTIGGATVEIQGSLDGGTTWTVLADPQGTAISKTTLPHIEAILEAVPRIRAILTVAGAGATVNVRLYLRKGA